MTDAVATTNHTVIRSWVESRNGQPVRAGRHVLRIDFGDGHDGFRPIQWDEFFEVFEDARLAFLHQDMLDTGEPSRYNRLVARP